MSRLLEFVSLLMGGRKGGVRTRKAAKYGRNPSFSERNGSGLSFHSRSKQPSTMVTDSRAARGKASGSLAVFGVSSSPKPRPNQSRVVFKLDGGFVSNGRMRSVIIVNHEPLLNFLFSWVCGLAARRHGRQSLLQLFKLCPINMITGLD